MILRGIIDSSLNGQLCFRGFAPIKELERISKADYSYQRNPIEGREDIIDFLEKQTYLFFPEIILSYKFQHDFSKPKSETPPLQAIQLGKNYKSNVDSTEFKIKKLDYKSLKDSRGTSEIRVIELIIDDEYLGEAIKNENEPFHRIDGNHRLRAAETSKASKVTQMVAPFCILLGEQFIENGVVQDNRETKVFDKSVKVFFHNINTKTIPLTSEQNLKVIIDDEEQFPNDELEEILGPHAILTRELIDKVGRSYFTTLSDIIDDKYRTFYNGIFKYLLDRKFKSKGLADRVFESLKSLEQIYKKNNKLKKCDSLGILTALLYYHVKGDERKFNHCLHWILDNQIYQIKEIGTKTLIEVFDKLSEVKHISLFVAMPYWSHAKVNEYNKLFKECLKELQPRLKTDVSLELIPIMRFKGESKRIDRRLLDSIDSCEVFVADITECNPNVLFEVAYAEGSNKPMILLKKESDEAEPPFDMDKLQWIPYDGDAYYTAIKGIVKNNLKEILKVRYGIV